MYLAARRSNAGGNRISAWTWHQLIASDRDLVLLRVTDRPIQDAFGLYRAEETDTLPCPSAAQEV